MLLSLGYGESMVVKRLKPTYPDITREKVRTIRLREDGRTHKESVKDTRERVIVQGFPSLQEAAVHVARAWVAIQRHGEDLAHLGQHLPPESVAAGAAVVALVKCLSALQAEVPMELVELVTEDAHTSVDDVTHLREAN